MKPRTTTPKPETVELLPPSERATLALLKTYGEGHPRTFNVRGLTGDVGSVLEAIAADDPDRVPVGVVRAGARCDGGPRWALVVYSEDFPLAARGGAPDLLRDN